MRFTSQIELVQFVQQFREIQFFFSKVSIGKVCYPLDQTFADDVVILFDSLIVLEYCVEMYQMIRALQSQNSFKNLSKIQFNPIRSNPIRLFY